MNEQPVSKSESRQETGWFVAVNSIILVAAAVYLRCTQLGTIPGVNGDECWYGNFALDILHGRSTSFLTPNGNPVNPFYMLPTLLLHAISKPSILLLRLVPLISGLLTLIVLPWATDRILGRRTAVMTLILLATMPLMVAYSRFAWDASQIPLVTGLLVLASIHAMRVTTTTSVIVTWGLLVAAVLIHPTCIFLGLIPYFSRQQFWMDWLKYFLGDQAPRIRKATAITTVLLMLYFGVRLLKFWVRGRPLTQFTIENLSVFFKLLGNLFSGKTVYEYISGAPCEGWIWTVQGWGLLILLTWGLIKIYKSPELQELHTVSTGFLLGLLAYFIVAGPSALRPGYERYGVLLFSPVILLLSSGVLKLKLPAQFKPEYLVILFGYLFLYQFQSHYLDRLAATGGQTHPTFVVATPDAKQQAAELILSRRPETQPVLILTPDFHCWQPLRYFLENAAGTVQVALVQNLQQARTEIESFPGQENPLIWVVDFSNPADKRDSFLPALAEELNLQTHLIQDIANNPVIIIAGPPEK